MGAGCRPESVWWPSTDVLRFDGGHLPIWDEDTNTYLDRQPLNPAPASPAIAATRGKPDPSGVRADCQNTARPALT
jgi:hypothetical protein